MTALTERLPGVVKEVISVVERNESIPADALQDYCDLLTHAFIEKLVYTIKKEDIELT